jgi:hypothetical protein
MRCDLPPQDAFHRSDDSQVELHWRIVGGLALDMGMEQQPGDRLE